MAQKCLSGCVKGVKGLPELLRPRLGGRAAGASHRDRQPDPAVLQDGMAASIPQLSCPGLISRSQSALSEDGAASFTPQRPTLLTASKAVSPSHGEKLSEHCGAEAENDGSLSALTTATAFEEAGSPGNAQTYGCCIAGMPRSDSPEWFWDTSMAIGSAAWTGGRHVASFLGEQIYEAAVMAQPHVQSMATSAANALKVAAEDSVDTLRALGPRKSKMSKLDRARASLALPPPVLQAPALPSLPELDAYTAQMTWMQPSYSAQPHMQGHALGGPAPWSNYPPRCSSFSAQNYGYAPNYAGYSCQSYPPYQVYQNYQCYDPQPQQLQPSYSFDVSQGRYSLGRRVPLAQNRIISATKVEQ